MGVNARTPCRGDWRGGVLSYSAWHRREFGPGCAADAGADRLVSGPTPPGSMLSNRVLADALAGELRPAILTLRRRTDIWVKVPRWKLPRQLAR